MRSISHHVFWTLVNIWGVVVAIAMILTLTGCTRTVVRVYKEEKCKAFYLAGGGTQWFCEGDE